MKSQMKVRNFPASGMTRALPVILGGGFLLVSATLPITTAAVGITFYPENSAKAIVLNLTFSDVNPLTYNSGAVATKQAGGYAAEPAEVQVALTDVYGNPAGAFTLASPLRVRGYHASGEHSEVISALVDFPLHFQFDSDGSTALIIDNFSNSELTIDLKTIIHDFCASHLTDPDCYESDLEVTSVAAVDPPPLVLLGQAHDYTIRTMIVNNGPESPAGGVDALFNQQVGGVAPGISVTPIGGVVDQQEFDLLVDTLRSNDQIYTVTCLEPGNHSVTFTSSIAPLSAAVIDLDSDNDSGSFTLTIDCAVPVTLNNKPHSYPNSVNVNKSGNIPVAVLTTEAGEYGNPIAFDASTIQVETVHFGEPNLAATDNGAMESHETLHLKRSYELDDKSRDADDDGVMHFKVLDTGLSSGDTEVCIKGKFFDNSNLFTFFGCDSVRVIE